MQNFCGPLVLVNGQEKIGMEVVEIVFVNNFIAKHLTSLGANKDLSCLNENNKG